MLHCVPTARSYVYAIWITLEPMSRIIAIANQKGGVGKTTTTVNLSAALASMHKRVLLIDLDPQGNATTGCGIDKHDVEKSVFDVLVDGLSVTDASQKSPENGLDVLPANSDLTAAEVELMSMDEREQRLHQALGAVRDNYDFVLIDCPPSLNILTLNAFVAADSVLVPVQCEYYALEGLSALLETIEGVRESVNHDIAIEGLLRTMYDGRNKLGVEVSAQLIEHFGDQVFRTVVPRNVRLAEAPSHGVSIMGYDSTSRGALAYLALAGEIVRQRARVTPQAIISTFDTASEDTVADSEDTVEDAVMNNGATETDQSTIDDNVNETQIKNETPGREESVNSSVSESAKEPESSADHPVSNTESESVNG